MNVLKYIFYPKPVLLSQSKKVLKHRSFIVFALIVLCRYTVATAYIVLALTILMCLIIGALLLADYYQNEYFLLYYPILLFLIIIHIIYDEYKKYK